jgi:hypothetical protein
MALQVVSLTMREATQLGIVTCKHCGLPRNNHFSHGKKVCAHRPCQGYEPMFTVGTPIRKKK